MSRLFNWTLSIAAGVMAWSGSAALADPPLFAPPHGLMVVEIDENNQLFSNSATGEFDSSMIHVNAAGQTILAHNKGGFLTGPVRIFPGGIAERDGDSPTDPATTSSKKLLADDPGIFADGGVFPAPDYVVSMNFHNALRFFDGVAWTQPVNGEELRIFDLTNNDDTNGPPADLELVMTGETSGLLGTVNIGRTGTAVAPINVTGIHGHLGYELSRPDDGVPAVGAYMIELTISATEDPSAGSPVLGDSDPIFVVFNNQLNTADYGQAVSAAQALPEPSTAVIVTAIGVGGLLGFRRRQSGVKQRSKGAPWFVRRGRDLPDRVSVRI